MSLLAPLAVGSASTCLTIEWSSIFSTLYDLLGYLLYDHKDFITFRNIMDSWNAVLLFALKNIARIEFEFARLGYRDLCNCSSREPWENIKIPRAGWGSYVFCVINAIQCNVFFLLDCTELSSQISTSYSHYTSSKLRQSHWQKFDDFCVPGDIFYGSYSISKRTGMVETNESI